MQLKRLLQLLLVFLLPGMLMAQVTTSSITGTVKSSDGKPLDGATVKAVHTPTGSVYSTVSNEKGQYNLANLRVGGPYTITVNYVGFAEQNISDVYLTLGNPENIQVTLTDSKTELNAVTVTASGKGAVISSLRNGTSTFISQRQIQGMPTVNRNIQDYVRLMPQVKVGTSAGDGAATGISFGGQNNRYNQFSIDGANATDGFGLGSTGTNGGQANVNPISMESIQEIQIVMSPYDVTQGGFTGGGINAVTKSGSNMVHGSAYGQYQNQGFVGKSVSYDSGIARNSYQNFKNYTFGASLSGAIVKNKLFFYVNAEAYKKTTPLAFDPTIDGSGSKVNKDTLEYLRNYLISKYKYDPGTYGALTNQNKSTSIFARIDWNIDDKNKLAVRFNHVDGYNDILSRSATTGVFSKSGYRFNDKNNSFVAELNSNISATSSNVLRVTYTAVRDSRLASSNFPSLTLNNYNFAQGAGITYNIGGDYSSQVNGLNQDTWTLTDNYTLYKGAHTLTFGTDNSFYKSTNWFLQGYNGSYSYGVASATGVKGIDAFVNNTTGPNSYSIGYGTADSADKAPAKLKAAQLSVYAQDVWAANDNFKLTYGLRIDAPVFFSTPAENTAFNTAFLSYGAKTNQMPKATPLLSPRVGFNWNIKGKGLTQLRGGAGIFTGRIPFVWISNQMSNTGIASQNLSYNATTGANIRFNYDPTKAHLGAYVPTGASVSGLTINVIDKNFKFPQVFKANLAVDQKLPILGLIGTLEAVYTKTLNNATYQNLNISAGGDSSVLLGASTRPYWSKFTKGPLYGNVIKLLNTNEGYSYNVTAQIQKPYENGWSGSIAYTFGHSTSLNDLTSSVALSNWRSPVVAYGLNNPSVARSNFDLGSRVVGYLSKEFRYSKYASTSFTLVYTGQSGQLLSYVYGTNVQGDYGIGSTSGTVDLVYIPKTLTDARLVDITGTNAKTAAQQWADYQLLVKANPYLSDHAGEVAKRNGARLPWENHFDFKIAQNFMVGQHKLEIFYSVLNIGNLLNKDWGWAYSSSATDTYGALSYANKSLFSAVTSGTPTINGTAVSTAASVYNPYMTFNIGNFTKIKGNYRPYAVSDFASRWSSIIGVRYSF